jgi:hypothetical protein
MVSRCFSGAQLFLAFAASALASAQTYSIRIGTSVSAGQRYAVTASGVKTSKASAGDRVVKEEEYQVTFTGLAEVIEVDRSGRPFKIAFTVDSLKKTSDGQTVDLVNPGTVVLADGSQEDPFSLKDGKMDKALQDAFGVVYSAHKPNDVSGDDIFGIKTPRGIGESWPINDVAAIKSLAENGVIIPEGRLSGIVSLIGKDKVGSTDCLSLRGEMKADGLSSKKFPPSVKVEEAKLHASFRGCLPLDGAGLSHSAGADLTFVVLLARSDGQKLEVALTQKMDAVWSAIGN